MVSMKTKDNQQSPPVIIQSDWFWGASIHVIAADGKALVKMVIDNDNTEDCDLYDLNTHPSCRRQGYATMLMQEAEKIALSMGIKRLNLWVEKKSWMEQWYRQMGFYIEEFRKPPNENTIWMVKYLLPYNPPITKQGNT